MASEPLFRVDGVEYPVPQAFRLGDPVLVKEVTGLDWMEFAELLDAGSTGDPSALLGMVAVAVWQKNPSWRRERVRKLVEGLAFDQLEFEAADENPTVAASPAATTGSSPEVSDPAPEPS